MGDSLLSTREEWSIASLSVAAFATDFGQHTVGWQANYPGCRTEGMVVRRRASPLEGWPVGARSAALGYCVDVVDSSSRNQIVSR